MKKILVSMGMIFVVLVLLCACGGAVDTSTDVESDTDAGTSDTQTDATTTIKVEYIAGEGGTILGELVQTKEVKQGENVTFSEVAAAPLEGYIFSGWSDGKKEAKRTDTLSESTVFEAVFEKIPKATITYSSQAGGYIIGEGPQTFELGMETIAVMAVAYDGYRFVGWSDGKTDETRSDIVIEDITYYAIFEQIQYVYITYDSENGGEIDGKIFQRLEKGQTTETVTAVPNTGYHFVEWSDGLKEPTRSDLAEEDKTYTAIFSNEVSVEYKASEGGSISGNALQNLYWSNTSKEVVAVPNEGYGFVCWDDGVTTPNRTDKVKSDLVLTAIFKKLCTIEFVCDEKYGTLEGETLQSVAQTVTTKEVTAVPNEGYSFMCWSNGDNNPTITIVADDDVTLVPYFSYESAGLPVISVQTENGVEINSKTEYFNCTVTVNDVDGGNHIIEKSAQIRGRGNSTWNLPNKPYKIKFNEKQSLFDYGKAKDWVLLANYGDISLVRNYISYQTAKKLSELEASPDSYLVEVYVNGAYQGVYLLCEQVEVNKHRVEVDEDITKIDTGYLIEMDEWNDGTYVTVNDNLSSSREYTVKFPSDEEITDEHLAFIKDFLERAIAAAQGDDYSAAAELIDVKSFAQMYLLAEIFKCPDVDYSSFYMYKDAGGKLVAGPIWDYDMAFGNVAHRKGDGIPPLKYDLLWAKNTNPWFNALLSHSEFVDLVVNELKASEEIFRSTIKECYDYAYSKREAMEKCFEDRKTVDTFFTPDELSNIPSWQEHMDQVNEFFENSMAYVKKAYLIE